MLLNASGSFLHGEEIHVAWDAALVVLVLLWWGVAPEEL